MTGAFVCGDLLCPLVLLALSGGAGLLVRQLSGAWLPAVLVLPVGFGLVVATCAFATYISFLAPAAGYIVLAFALARIAFAAIGAPTLLPGTPTWTGYSRIVDIGFQMDFARYVAELGRVSAGNNSSYDLVVGKLLNIGYPGGAQVTLGAI